MPLRLRSGAVALAVLLLAGRAAPHAQLSLAQRTAIDASLFKELRWRNIGPFIGGLTPVVAGAPQTPGLFYAGTAGGGLWKTTDYGRTWASMLDQTPASAISALAVSATSPTVMIGTGSRPEESQRISGRGLFVSDDGGGTWSEARIAHAESIASVALDPGDRARSFAGVWSVRASGASGASSTSGTGVYRSADGGRSFQLVLARGAGTGAVDVAISPTDGRVVYATLGRSRPSDGTADGASDLGSGVFRSNDGGTTWQPLMNGLPRLTSTGANVARLAISPSNARRLYVTISGVGPATLFRSDDGGDTWIEPGSGSWSTGTRSSLPLTADPRNPDVVYLVGAAVWRSTDGGRTFARWHAARDGERFAELWLHPTDPNVLLLGGDRGATVSVTAGRTWSAWDNQPTARLMRVTADSAVPYRLCATQVTRPAFCLPSRSESGGIAAFDLVPIGDRAGGVAVPDPGDAEIVFAGVLGRLDRRTGGFTDTSPPRVPGARMSSNPPLIFANADSRVLYFGANTIWKSISGGSTWTEVSDDLTRGRTAAPGTAAANLSHAVISVLTNSSIDARVVWAGSDDGLVHVTRDAGASWVDVTPAVPGLTDAEASIVAIEASHFDLASAYVGLDARRRGDIGPHLLRTRDGGRTWVELGAGLPTDEAVLAIREDQYRRGLLFAGTEQSVYVSFDDGDRWQPLTLNLPRSPVRDIVVKDGDVTIATEGRGLWVLDDISPLRQVTPDVAKADGFIFRPAVATRLRASVGRDERTDGSLGENPPPGIVLSYLIGTSVTGPVTLEIIESLSGDVIRRFATGSNQPSSLPDGPGLHRVAWDLRYTPIPNLDSGAPASPGVIVQPGTYQVRLSAGGRSWRQAVTVRLDPRLRLSAADLGAQFSTAKRVADALRDVGAVLARPAPTRSPEATTALRLLDADLRDSLARLQRFDARPSPTLDAEVSALVSRAERARDGLAIAQAR